MVIIKKGGVSNPSQIQSNFLTTQYNQLQQELNACKGTLQRKDQELLSLKNQLKQQTNKYTKAVKNQQNKNQKQIKFNSLIKKYPIIKDSEEKIRAKIEIEGLGKELGISSSEIIKKLNSKKNNTKKSKKSIFNGFKKVANLFKPKNKNLPPTTTSGGGSKNKSFKKYIKNPLTGRRILKNGKLAKKLKKNNIL